MTTTTITVQILDHDYQVRCGQGEVEDLMASAKELDARMRKARSDANVHGLDRIAVTAALNIAHDNLGLRKRLRAVDNDVGELTDRVAAALADLKSEATGTQPAGAE